MKRVKIGAAILGLLIVAGCIAQAQAPQGGAPTGGGAPSGAQSSSGGRGQAGATATATAITVNTATPIREDLSLQTSYIGTIAAAQSVNVYPKASGTVTAVYFEAGQTVKAGDLLFELDSTDALLSVQQAQLAYDLSIANIESSESGASATLDEINYQRSIETALQNYENAKTSLELATDDDFNSSAFRAARKKLSDAQAAYDENPTADNYQALITAQQNYYITIDDYSSYKSLLNSLESAYTAYEDAVKKYEVYKSITLVEGSYSNDIKRQQAELTLLSAQKSLENTKIYAPISGVIETKSVSLHSTANSNTVAYTISNKDYMSVGFNVSADGATVLSIGEEVAVEKGGLSYVATITEIDTKANTAGLFPVSATLTESGSALLSGVAVKVTAATASSENAMVIAVSNITYEDQKPYVYLFENGTAVKTFIELGITTRQKAEVTAGLTDSSKVITTWHPNLADGVAVVESSGV